MERIFKHILHWAFPILSAAIAIFVGYRYVRPSYNDLVIQRAQKVVLGVSLKTKMQTFEDLKYDRTRFYDSPEFVEQLARRDNRVFDNEIVFHFK